MSFQAAYVTVILLLAAQEAYSTNCPDGWMGHKGSCYLFMQPTLNWFDAITVCNDQGGHLAEVSSQEEHNYLKGIVMAHGYRGRATQAWIGMEDFAEEGLFIWTRTKQTVSTFYWKQGEPKDERLEEDCVAMDGDGWFDSNCEDARYSFICQTAPTEAPLIGRRSLLRASDLDKLLLK